MRLGKSVDWILFGSFLPLLLAGLVTMNSFVRESYFFNRQILWIAFSLLVFFIFAHVDWRFLRRGGLLLALYLFFIGTLLYLQVAGEAVRGSQSWITAGWFNFQPADFTKLALVLVLAKYFSRRHVAIAHVRHVVVSGLYALLPAGLIFLQHDFGSAVIIFLIWLGMIMVSGVSKKHLASVCAVSLLLLAGLWFFGFTENQKKRIITFVDPFADIQGSGYNVYQSVIAVGSGNLFGKGIGYGTQSRLEFLPEYETDFIFAAFAEEWGFVGVFMLFALFGVLFFRILVNASRGDTNFEVLYGLGIAIFFMSHFVIHVGMNIGILPVTGLPIPFLSYGGSHLLVELAALGILVGMRRYARAMHKERAEGEEFVGLLAV